MPFRNTPESFGTAAKGLHWFSALIVLALLPLGFYMTALAFSPFKLDLYWWHKSFGTLVFFLVLARLAWRMFNPAPPALDTHAPWEKQLAKIVHVLLYAGMIGMPVSGILMSAAGDYPRPFFGLFEMPDAVPGKNEAVFNLMKEIHEVFGYALLAAVGLHGAGAFKHHLIDRDGTLRRMLPGVASRFAPFLVAGIFVAAMAMATGLAVRSVLHELAQESPVQAADSQQAATLVSPEPAQSAAGAASAPEWILDTTSSRISFTAQAQGQDFGGQFDGLQGRIAFDPANLPQSHADISVAIAGVKTGNAERDGYAVMPPWLDAANFPQARFVTESITRSASGSYEAAGTLTLRGVSLPVTVPFDLVITEGERGQHAQMQGQFTINRLDYGIGAGEWAAPDNMAHDVTIDILLKAERQP